MNGHYYKLSYHALVGCASLIILIITAFTKNSENSHRALFSVRLKRQTGLVVTLCLSIISLTNCVQLAPPPTSSIVPPLGLPTQVIAPTPTSLFPWTDENAVMSGICFEAALDAAGKVFTLRNSQEHIQFYDLADNSKLCRHPVTRSAFDFASAGGRVLAGLWSYGKGCTARHDVLAINRDDDAKSLTIQLQFVTEGACDYELLRPFWIGLDDVGDYQINIQVAGTGS
jgi:hypothetical protein